MHHRHYDDGLHKTLETDITKTSDYSNTAITPQDSKMPRLRLPTYYSSTKEGNILIYGSLDGKGTINKRDNLAYKSFQMSAPSYRFSQFGMFNVDKWLYQFLARAAGYENAAARTVLLSGRQHCRLPE